MINKDIADLVGKHKLKSLVVTLFLGFVSSPLFCLAFFGLLIFYAIDYHRYIIRKRRIMHYCDLKGMKKRF